MPKLTKANLARAATLLEAYEPGWWGPDHVTLLELIAIALDEVAAARDKHWNDLADYDLVRERKAAAEVVEAARQERAAHANSCTAHRHGLPCTMWAAFDSAQSCGESRSLAKG